MNEKFNKVEIGRIPVDTAVDVEDHDNEFTMLPKDKNAMTVT